MLHNITIQDYRCLKNFRIDGLAQVNVIVGENNAGKTTLLQFIKLFSNPGVKRIFLSSNQRLEREQLIAAWNCVLHKGKEVEVLQALRAIEPAIEKILFSVDVDALFTLRLHDQRLIPLEAAGKGMQRLIELAIATIACENGILLVDGIELGLYWETQGYVWQFVLGAAQELNVQVVATTHSWDCIAAYQEALDELEDSSIGKLFRLSRKGEGIRVVEYKADKLSIAVRQSIEVR